MILTKEILLFQKRAGIITEVEYKEKIKIIDGKFFEVLETKGRKVFA